MPGWSASPPKVRVTDAGPPSDPGLRPPWSLRKRSRITLVATAQAQASVAEASFYIDKTLTDCAKAGDQMHLSRDAGCGLGFSLIRGGKLVAAAGGTVRENGDGAMVVSGLDTSQVGDLAYDNSIRLHELAPAQASL